MSIIVNQKTTCCGDYIHGDHSVFKISTSWLDGISGYMGQEDERRRVFFSVSEDLINVDDSDFSNLEFRSC